MSWTDERITLLQQLWSDGLSASQIANQLGGVTRNAVIGKVHRLGLSDKSRVKAGNHRNGQQPASAPKPMPEAAKPEAIKGEPASVTSLSEAREAKQAGAKDAAASAVETPAPETAPAPEPTNEAPSAATPDREPLRTQAEPVVVASAPEKGSIGILELTEQTCRWPFGDPTKPGFHFCGAHSPAGNVYCEEHAKVAFQPVEARRRR